MSMEITGLSLNIIGTIMLFRYGFPQPNFEESVGSSPEEEQ